MAALEAPTPQTPSLSRPQSQQWPGVETVPEVSGVLAEAQQVRSLSSIGTLREGEIAATCSYRNERLVTNIRYRPPFVLAQVLIFP
jgi:hypothetical protein